MAAKSKSRAGDLRLWRNARLTTMADGSAGLGVVEHGAVAARDGRIVYAGPSRSCPRHLPRAPRRLI
ncbi:imidazolonepropionase, partial [Mesorhizobium sp. M7A.F.Ca.CA.003.01.2.1]